MGLLGWVNTRPMVPYSPYGMASGGQEKPFSRLALAVVMSHHIHRRALHILFQFLAGKFKMEFLPTISPTKAFPAAQICSNLHKIVPISKANP